MRYQGHNILAIVAAAVVIYLIEFVIFAVLIPGDQYMAMTGMVEGQGDASRMPVGVVMPILTAIGLSLVIKWRNAPGAMAGLSTGLLMAVLFGFSTSLYGYVYGAHTAAYLPINLGHFLVCWGVAGAIIGAWK
ncbi:MAG: DUF1761 domain-containing protein [Caulobacterales bacterium]|jgi:hypothetical protein|nr:DUF1761 domain-containing protein [Caulobacterales bacterium]